MGWARSPARHLPVLWRRRVLAVADFPVLCPRSCRVRCEECWRRRKGRMVVDSRVEVRSEEAFGSHSPLRLDFRPSPPPSTSKWAQTKPRAADIVGAVVARIGGSGCLAQIGALVVLREDAEGGAHCRRAQRLASPYCCTHVMSQPIISHLALTKFISTGVATMRWVFWQIVDVWSP